MRRPRPHTDEGRQAGASTETQKVNRIDEPKPSLAQSFQTFVEGFRDESGESKYLERMLKAKVDVGKPFIVDFPDLYNFNPELTSELVRAPRTVLRCFHESDAAQYSSGIHIRGMIQQTPIRLMGSSTMGELISVRGIVVKASQDTSRVDDAVYRCASSICYPHITTTVKQNTQFLTSPIDKCEDCDERKWLFDPETSTYRDSQSISMQETPDQLPSGEIPRKLDVLLLDELVKTCNPGDLVEITGIVNVRQQAPTSFKLDLERYLEANHVEVMNKQDEGRNLTEREKAEIIEIARDERVLQRFIHSIAPSIYGYNHIKEAIVLQQFGSPAIQKIDVRKRGDIHILLCGDPGCFVAGTLVPLADGTFKRIEDLGKTHLQSIDILVYSDMKLPMGRATVFHKYEDQPLLQIELDAGRRLVGTYNQQIKILDNNEEAWRRLDELSIDDKVITEPFIPCIKTDYIPLNWIITRGRFGPHARGKLPTEVTPALASIFALLTTDGSVCPTRLVFSVNLEEQDKIELIRQNIKTVFSEEPLIRKSKAVDYRSGMIIIELNDCDVVYNCEKFKSKAVPDEILQSGNEVLAEYLRWVFDADGCCFCKGRGRRGVQLRRKKMSRRANAPSGRPFLQDIQILLSRFNIKSTIVGTNLTIRRSSEIIKFAEKIGFVCTKKKDKLIYLINHLPTIRSRKPLNIDHIKTITPLNPETTYDIEIPGHHTLIANGIISHNTAKTEFLRIASSLIPRGIYTMAGRSSKAGLTAGIVKDEKTGAPTLEAGACVLADMSVVALDEIEKMDKNDRSALHPVMEQQKVAVSLAGISATLNARCAVIGAGNPIAGRWDSYHTVTENIALPPALLSRFDLIFIMIDSPDTDKDNSLAERILDMDEEDGELLSREQMRRYILYAKGINPEMPPEFKKKIRDYYVGLRRGSEGQAIMITPRQLESIPRLSKALARVHLHEKVTESDLDEALRLFRRSMEDVGIDPETGKTDFDAITTGKTRNLQDKTRMILSTVRKISQMSIDHRARVDDVRTALMGQGWSADEFDRVEALMNRDGVLFRPSMGYVAVVS